MASFSNIYLLKLLPGRLVELDATSLCASEESQVKGKGGRFGKGRLYEPVRT